MDIRPIKSGPANDAEWSFSVCLFTTAQFRFIISSSGLPKRWIPRGQVLDLYVPLTDASIYYLYYMHTSDIDTRWIAGAGCPSATPVHANDTNRQGLLLMDHQRTGQGQVDNNAVKGG